MKQQRNSKKDHHFYYMHGILHRFLLLIPTNFKDLTKNLLYQVTSFVYDDQEATVRSEYGTNKWFIIGKYSKAVYCHFLELPILLLEYKSIVPSPSVTTMFSLFAHNCN